MPARKQQNVAWDVANAAHDAIGPDADLIRCFSSRTTVAKQLPARTLFVDLLCATSLILTVIPFQQIAVALRFASEAGQLASPHRPLQRAREHFCESDTLQAPAQTVCIEFATFSERQICEASVLA